jgi:3-carboxy-cis,cis-muconate cycloisomerase
VRRSSLTSERGLFGGIYGRGGAATWFDDQAWLQAMLDVEAALVRACAQEGLVPSDAAERVAAACVADRVDAAVIARETARHASPVVPLVAALRAAVGEPDAEYVHVGATSQDILDTALMLNARRGLTAVLEDAGGAADAAARLADEHRRTPVAGRTLLQQALPTSFGLHAAGWLTGIDAARASLARIASAELPVQMGGPVGTRDPAVGARVAAELGLADPAIPWHTVRVASANLACALGVLAGVLGKVARDVTLMAQQEVGELREGTKEGRGTSSAMSHKRNPVGAVSVLACSKRTPGVVSTVLACMEQEHERAAGAWQAEWGAHGELIGLVGSATAWSRELLENLEVDTERMRDNLERLASAGVGAAQSPQDHLGAATKLIDRALATRAV